MPALPPALRATSPVKGEERTGALSKEMGSGKTFFKDAVLDRPEAPLGASDVFSAFRESRAYHLVPSSQATRRTKPPSAISQRHRRRPAAVKIAAGDLRRADSFRPSMGEERIPLRCESARDPYHLVPSSQATRRTKPPSAISQRHRRRPAAVKIAAGDLRRADSFRPSMGEERIPLRCESARDPYHLVPSSQATRRTKPPSAISQRKGKAAMVIRRPVTSSISPPAFSTVHTPLCM